MRKLLSFYTNEFKDYLLRNKIFYLISILFILFSISFGYQFMSIDDIENMGDEAFVPVDDWDKDYQFIDLFKHNLLIDLTCILSGITFSLISMIINFINGMLVGYVLKIAPVEIFILGIVPHGIFEIPSSVVAFVGSLNVTKIEINLIKGVLQNNKTFKGELYNASNLFKDVLISLLIVCILLILAAFIEAYITPDLLNWYIGIINS